MRECFGCARSQSFDGVLLGATWFFVCVCFFWFALVVDVVVLRRVRSFLFIRWCDAIRIFFGNGLTLYIWCAAEWFLAVCFRLRHFVRVVYKPTTPRLGFWCICMRWKRRFRLRCAAVYILIMSVNHQHNKYISIVFSPPKMVGYVVMMQRWHNWTLAFWWCIRTKGEDLPIYIAMDAEMWTEMGWGCLFARFVGISVSNNYERYNCFQ